MIKFFQIGLVVFTSIIFLDKILGMALIAALLTPFVIAVAVVRRATKT